MLTSYAVAPPLPSLRGRLLEAATTEAAKAIAMNLHIILAAQYLERSTLLMKSQGGEASFVRQAGGGFA